jgi:hypothetical protein
MIRLALLSLMLSAPVGTTASADVVGPGGKIRACFCTDQNGDRVELGQTICLNVDGRSFMAQCQMSLNVPMWREVQEGCLSSQLQVPDPGLDPAPVYPKI